MKKMQELYNKVAGDVVLQEKFADIINGAAQNGPEATEKSLLSFAKEAGYDVTIAELQEFVKDLMENDNGELTEMELDMVAGGKLTTKQWGQIAGGTIAVASIVGAIAGGGPIAGAGCGAGSGIVEGIVSSL